MTSIPFIPITYSENPASTLSFSARLYLQKLCYNTWFLLLTYSFTGQVLLYGRVLEVFLEQYLIFCVIMFSCGFFFYFFLSTSFTCSQNANFHGHQKLSTNNRVSYVLCLLSKKEYDSFQINKV